MYFFYIKVWALPYLNLVKKMPKTSKIAIFALYQLSAAGGSCTPQGAPKIMKRVTKTAQINFVHTSIISD